MDMASDKVLEVQPVGFRVRYILELLRNSAHNMPVRTLAVRDDYWQKRHQDN